MAIEFELFEGKTFKDLLKDIVTNSDNKRDTIDGIIISLKDKMTTINDAIILAPIIQSYLDTSVKNDDQLIKLSGIIQRLLCVQADATDGALGLSEEEKVQLMTEIKEINFDVKAPVVEVKHV